MKDILASLKLGFLKGLDFKGRVSRREFWPFFLANFLILMIISILDDYGLRNQFFEILAIAYILICFIPLISICVRRLHDINLSGFYVLLSCVPIINVILLLSFFKRGNLEENKYGSGGTCKGDALKKFSDEQVTFSHTKAKVDSK